MATKSKAAPAASKSTALAEYKEELAKLAKDAAAQESGIGGGKFFSTKAGVLSYDDEKMPGNRVACIILASRNENVFYEEKYDPENPTPPDCYAFGTDDKSMGPFSEVEEPLSDKCVSCPKNQWGSADKGRGKACRNLRRLALIPAGSFNKAGDLELFDEDQLVESSIAFMKVPPTSITAYAKYVKQLAAAEKPPCVVITEIQLEPDSDSQFKFNFTALDDVDGDLVPMLLKRHKEANELIEFAYGRAEEREEQAPKGRAAKPAAKTAPAKRGKY